MLVCSECTATAVRWEGRCPRCGTWGSLAEATAGRDEAAAPRPLRDVREDESQRRPTGVAELDRVLGGGAVAGSVVLVGGEPGIGKSTLLLACAARIGADALYVAGEESPAQVANRARRLGHGGSELPLVDCTDGDAVAALLRERRPAIAVVDSIQTIRCDDVDGAPGQPAQMRAAAERIVPAARASGTAVLLVGQVTKEGGLAGPRTLEHAVDVVCQLEGDRQTQIRALRGLKNRFGPTDEIGLFEMTERGLVEMRDASAALLSGRADPGPGDAVGVALEGRRALCVEVQALVGGKDVHAPVRRSQGLDVRRLEVLVASLAARCGCAIACRDVYVKIVGGLELRDPGLDLAVAVSVFGAFHNQPFEGTAVAIGEVGLQGEVRPVGQMTARLKEARAMGFTRAYVPRGTEPVDGIRVIEIESMTEAYYS